MRDYEELVSCLRIEADGLLVDDKPDMLLYDSLNDAADAIEELVRNADKFKWISVEERLPEAKKEVIVCDKTPNGTRYVTTALILEDCGFWNDCGKMYEVTHWMPLPEPPKEDDDA